MARVTIERSLDKCESRFELVVLVSYRAHAIACGSQTAVNSSNKFAVIALREVENGNIDIDQLRKTVIEKYALENKTSVASNSFMIDDESVIMDDNNQNNVQETQKKQQDHKLLNVDKNYFA